MAQPAPGSFHDPVSGQAGVRVQVRDAGGELVHDVPSGNSVVTWWDSLPPIVHRRGTQIVMRTRYRATAPGPHVIGAAGIGRMRVFIDGVERVDQATEHPPRDVVFALSRPPEVRVPVDLKAGQEIDVRLEHTPDVDGHQPGFITLRLGIAPDVDDDTLMARAVAAAAAADVAVVVVGSADGTESEGFDRDTLELPGRQDELVRRIGAANPNTVVVVNTGMPVLMPWAGDVAAVLQAWFPGQAFGEALADVLTGSAEPGGRLPVTLPRAEGDSPVLFAVPDAGNLVYSEGLLVGYRGYDRGGAEPLFGFGHGLGYTEWEYVSIEVAGDDVSVTVRNTGSRPGREVVQVYVEAPEAATRPVRALAGFVAVDAAPGETVRARVGLDPRALMQFDEADRAWVSRPGTYTIRAGRSSRDLRVHTTVVR